MGFGEPEVSLSLRFYFELHWLSLFAENEGLVAELLDI